jgi:serine/threonine protein kinase
MSGARRRFRFIKEIAEGGFGKVYLAEQLSQDGFSRIVALKLLHQKWSTHDEVVMRTRDEARLLGLIRHQHIVRVEDLTSVDGKLAIVMEYLEGVDLKNIMNFLKERGEVFPRQSLFEIMIAVASALDAAYNGEPLQGGEPLRVIHRDIKPSNIFVTVNGGVKVLDFGTARANFDSREAKTQALAFGSQGYMAPERMLGEEDTPAADVFSLGVTLQELLSLEPFGRIPPRPNKFVAKIEERIAATPLTGDPEWVEQVRDTLGLMMAYEPSERPSAKQLIDIFEILAQGAGDVGMRRFCRTTVTEAKAALPAPDADDGLAGALIEEDPSSVWGIESGPVPTGARAGGQPVEPPPSATPAGAPKRGGGAVAPQPPPPPPKGKAKAAPAKNASDTFDDEDELEPPKKGGGAFKMILVAMVLVVVLGGVAVVLALVVIVGVLLANQGGGAVVASSGDTGSAGATVAPTTGPAPDLPAGGRIVDPGREPPTPSARAKSAVLKLNGDSAAAVTVSGSLGLKAEWDGRQPYDLGTVQAGKYRTIVVPASTGEKIRNTGFEVEAGRACEFTFDVKAKDWTGGCK